MSNLHKISAKIISWVLIAAIGVMSFRLFVVIFPKSPEKVSTENGIKLIQTLESADVEQRESDIQKAQDAYAARRSKAAQKQKQKKQSAYRKVNFKAACKNTGTLFSGDSLVKAIWEYGILDKSQVIAEIGASTHYLNDNVKKIVKKKPKVLVLHYGENEINGKDYAPIFISNYTKAIKKLQKKLPHTKIYVDSIWPVTKKAIKKEKALKNIPYYNKLLKQMAEELGVTYIDFTPQWKSIGKDYYDADGVHPIGPYYTDYYLPTILEKEGYRV